MPRRPRWFTERVAAVPEGEELRVSTLELFFDLVFVFTVTQLTHTLGEHLTDGVPQVLLMMGIIWWMYGGYAWLTNAVPPQRPARMFLMMIGMAAWLVVALAIPKAFDGTGLAFAVGFLVVVVVHGAMYLQSTSRFLPMFGANVTGGLLILAASTAVGPGVVRYGLWTLALLIMWGSPYIVGQEGFPLHPGHIVERYGVLMIVILGESVVAVGAGAIGQALDPDLVGVVVLGLAVAACMWWAYFVIDLDRAEAALRGTSDQVKRTRMVLMGFFYAHIPIVLGIVAFAAGVKKAIGGGGQPLTGGYEIALAAGIALFLLGSVAYLRFVSLRPSPYRIVAGLLALMTIPLGRVTAAAQLLALALLLIATLAIEVRLTPALRPPYAGPTRPDA